MFRRLIHATASVLTLAFAYWGYAQLVVPWIEPELSLYAVSSEQLNQAAAEYKFSDEKQRTIINAIFPKGAWETDTKTSYVKLDDFLLLTQDHRQLESRRYHLNPCTVVYRTDDVATNSGANRTWTVQADEGAIVTFDREIDPRKGDFGEPQSVFLVGQVVISGSPTKLDGSDRIQIETSGVNIEGGQIHTANEVHFRVGNSFGTGRDLRIKMNLLRGPKAKVANSPRTRLPSPSPSTIKEIRLEHLDLATLFLPQEKPSLDLDRPSGPGVPINVSCDGQVVVDFVHQVASISNNVRIQRNNTNSAPEQLHCDRLEVLFQRLLTSAPGTTSAVAGANPNTPHFQTSMPRLEPRKVIVSGSPAILSTSAQSSMDNRWHQIAANRLEYDLADSSRYGTNQQQAKRWFGNVSVQGPGEYQTGLSQPGRPVTTELKLSWQQRVEVRQITSSNPKNNDVELSVFGKTRCEFAALGQMFAERMRVLLREPGDDSTGLKLENITAEQSVKIETEQMVAFVNRMNVNVQELAQLHAPVAASVQALQAGPAGRPAEDSQLLLIAPDGGRLDVPRRFQVEGNTLNAELNRYASNYEIGKIVLDQNVRCVELVTQGNSRSNVEMTGTRFQLEHVSETGGIAVIHGAPAEIRVPQMRLVGTSIHLDRDRNQLWIDGSGAAVVPLPRNLAEKYPNRPPNADIRWTSGMQFDGQSIDCRGSVLVRGPAQDVNADQITANLTQSIDFGSRGLDDNQVELRSIVADGNVSLENRSFDSSGLISIDRARINRLTMNHQTEHIQGEGPGWIQTVRKGNPLSTDAVAQSSSRPMNPTGLSFLHVGFQQSFEGELAKRLMRFQGDVQAIYGPVQGWDDRVQATSHREMQPQTVRMRCQQLDVFQVPGQAKDKVELMATGKTYVEGKSTEGQLFAAQAHQLKYQQSKDLMMIQGDGSSDAQLWYQEKVGTRWSRLPAQQIRYWPKQNRCQMAGGNGLEINLGD